MVSEGMVGLWCGNIHLSTYLHIYLPTYLPGEGEDVGEALQRAVHVAAVAQVMQAHTPSPPHRNHLLEAAEGQVLVLGGHGAPTVG